MARKHPDTVEDLHFRVLKLLPDLSQRELVCLQKGPRLATSESFTAKTRQ